MNRCIKIAVSSFIFISIFPYNNVYSQEQLDRMPVCSYFYSTKEHTEEFYTLFYVAPDISIQFPQLMEHFLSLTLLDTTPVSTVLWQDD